MLSQARGGIDADIDYSTLLSTVKRLQKVLSVYYIFAELEKLSPWHTPHKQSFSNNENYKLSSPNWQLIETDIFLNQ